MDITTSVENPILGATVAADTTAAAGTTVASTASNIHIDNSGGNQSKICDPAPISENTVDLESAIDADDNIEQPVPVPTPVTKRGRGRAPAQPRPRAPRATKARAAAVPVVDPVVAPVVAPIVDAPVVVDEPVVAEPIIDAPVVVDDSVAAAPIVDDTVVAPVADAPVVVDDPVDDPVVAAPVADDDPVADDAVIATPDADDDASAIATPDADDAAPVADDAVIATPDADDAAPVADDAAIDTPDADDDTPAIATPDASDATPVIADNVASIVDEPVAEPVIATSSQSPQEIFALLELERRKAQLRARQQHAKLAKASRPSVEPPATPSMNAREQILLKIQIAERHAAVAKEVPRPGILKSQGDIRVSVQEANIIIADRPQKAQLTALEVKRAQLNELSEKARGL
jgi:hypothetical protein